MTIPQNLIGLLTGTTKSCNTLTEDDIWGTHSQVTIWESENFIDQPIFYPVYRYQNFYSYSPIALILKKGYLRINHRIVEQTKSKHFYYTSDKATIDLDVEQVGGPLDYCLEITTPEAYAQAIAQAMIADIQRVERNHPGYTNVLMVGGKDSLNLALLSWTNPVLIASAPPNDTLVKQFLKDNDLKYDFVSLEDAVDEAVFDLEVLTNCCRNNLMHCRWGVHLRRIAEQYQRKLIFWKGQLGGVYGTPLWKTYSNPAVSIRSRSLKAYARYISKMLPASISYPIERTIQLSNLSQAAWMRGARWQGAHLSTVRQVTGCLALSGYHGPKMRQVLSRVDMAQAVQTDIRAGVGKILHGDEVVYPEANPAPSDSFIRSDIAKPDAFFKRLQTLGVSIRD